MSETIICPKCKTEIPIGEALLTQIKTNLTKEIKDEQEKKYQMLIKQKEKELLALQKDYENKIKISKEELNQKLKIEKEKLTKLTEQKIMESVNTQIKDFQEQLKEKNEQLQKFRNEELQLRKKQRELEEKQKNQELELARKLDAERQIMQKEISSKLSEEYQFKVLEKEKKLQEALKVNEELRQKLEQGSQQTQGEVLELALEDILKNYFKNDEILPIAKGQKGADVLQIVKNEFGKVCGKIIWETKRTKNWDDKWIEKLKDDQREAKADLAVIVTTAFPKDVEKFSNVKGVWVIDFSLVIAISSVLRTGLIQLGEIQASTIGKNEKMEILYNYLTSPNFKQKLQAIVDAFSSMKKNLDTEKNAMKKIWKTREEQIQRVIDNTLDMYGSLQAIMGASLPEIESLELKALAAGEEER